MKRSTIKSIVRTAGVATTVYSILAFATTVVGIGFNNSWIDSNGKWENSNDWSRTAAPSVGDQSDLITNVGNNTVTIDATTTNSPGTLTINNLVVISNTVSLLNAGTNVPLHIMNAATLSGGASLLITNSALVIDGDSVIGAGAALEIGGTNLASMTVLAGSVVTVSTKSVGIGVVPGSGGTLTLAGGSFNVANVLTFGGLESTATVWVTGGNLIAGSVYVGGGAFASADSLILSNGTIRTSDLIIGQGVDAVGTMTMEGGTTYVNHQLIIGATVNNGTGILTLDGGSLFVTNPSTAMLVIDQGTLTLSNGATLVVDTLVTTNPSANFIILSGTLQVNNPAQVEQGTLTISGGTNQLGSNLTVAVSANSTGTVNVADGGQLVVTNGTLGIGNVGTITSGDGVGRMTVSGTLVAFSIVVGNTAGSQCDLYLTDGGVISDGGCPGGTNCQIVINSLGFQQTNGTVQACATPVELGVTSPGDTTVTGNSANDSFEYLYAGYSNVGTFTLNGGAVNVCAQFIVGHEGLDVSSVIATGAVWITGGQLTMNSEDSIVGNSGVGQMSISNGLVTAADVTVGNSANPSSFGTLTMAGGTLTMNSLVLPNSHSRFLFTGGCLNALGITNSSGQMLALGDGVDPITLNLLGGTSSLGTGLKIGTNVTVSGLGTITGNAMNYGLINSGTGALNFAGGVLTNYGTMLTTAGGVLNFYGQVVNNGLILTNGSVHFMGGLINNGLLLDPMVDTDGDGANNLSEALAGTSPINSASYFHIKSTAAVGSDIQVVWSTVGGKRYVVQAASGMTNTYTDISSVITVPGTGESTMSYTDTGAAIGPPKFYRVRLGP
jgi:hypothetical protein